MVIDLFRGLCSYFDDWRKSFRFYSQLMNKVQNNTKGIIFILLGMATFSIQDALIKFIYNDAALYELYFGRTLAAIILLVSYLKFSNKKIELKTYYPLLTTIRVI